MPNVKKEKIDIIEKYKLDNTIAISKLSLIFSEIGMNAYANTEIKIKKLVDLLISN